MRLNNILKQTVALVAALILTLGLLPQEALATGTVHYKGQAEGFVFGPSEDEAVTDLFPLLKDVMPGNSIKQDIEVHNHDANKKDVRIYLRALGADAANEAFLSQLRLTVEQVSGDRRDRHFEAAAHETAGLIDWVLLGTVPYNDNEVLELTLDVPITLGNEFQDAVGHLEWEFKVEEVDDSSSNNSNNSSNSGKNTNGGTSTSGGTTYSSTTSASRAQTPKTGDPTTGRVAVALVLVLVAAALILRGVWGNNTKASSDKGGNA